jgi:malonyl-CoA decarboxylase
LSPIPGFRAWLDPRLEADPSELLPTAEMTAIAELPGDIGNHGLAGVLANPVWYENPAVAQVIRPPLQRLCARYLLQEKGPQGRALDLVEHFHLTNGSRVERLNWLADRSPKGLQQSAGMMVNYLYRLDRVEENHESYTGDGAIAASTAIRGLARK